MARIDTKKIYFYVVCLFTIVVLSFGFGAYSIISQNSVAHLLGTILEDIKIFQTESLVSTKIRPEHMLQLRRHDGSGVTINNSPNKTDLILLSGFFEGNNELRLIRRNGEIVARWPVKYSELFPNPDHLIDPPKTDWNIDTHGALALPDGSVVFNFEYSGLVRLDKCGNVIWTLKKKTHHFVESTDGGGFWVGGRQLHVGENKTRFPPFQQPFIEDTILKISEQGEVLKEISIADLFYNSQLEALLTANGEIIAMDSIWDKELVHLNGINELSRDIADDFHGFKAGDLVLSLRNYNLLLIIDPIQERIKWWKTGPWIRQHDPQFIPGGKILLFNNNAYLTSFGLHNEFFRSSPTSSRISTILEHNLNTGETNTLYGGQETQLLLSIIRGKVDHTPYGGLLITEFEGGRALEVNTNNQIVWEYINGYNDEYAAEITESRLYPKAYFEVKDWGCTAQ